MFGSPQPQAQQPQLPFTSNSNNNQMNKPPQFPQPAFGQQSQNNQTQPTSQNSQANSFGFSNQNQNQGSFGDSNNSFNNQNAQTGFAFGSTGTGLSNNSNTKPFFGNPNNVNSQLSFGASSTFNNQTPNNNTNNQSFGSNTNNQATGCFAFGNNSQVSSNANSGGFGFNTQPQQAKVPAGANCNNLFANNIQAAVLSNAQVAIQQNQANLNSQPQNIFGNPNSSQSGGLFNNNQQGNNLSSNQQQAYNNQRQQSTNIFNNGSNQQQQNNPFNQQQPTAFTFGGNAQPQPATFFESNGFSRYNDFSYLNGLGYGPNNFSGNVFGNSQPTFVFNANVQPQFVFNHPSQRPRFVFNAPNQCPTFTFNNSANNPSFIFNSPSLFSNGFGFGLQPHPGSPTSAPGLFTCAPVGQPSSLFTAQTVVQSQINATIAETVAPSNTVPTNRNPIVTPSGSQQSLASNSNSNKAPNFSLFGSPAQPTLKPKEKRDEEKKLAAIIVTLCNGSSYDNLFSKVQQKTLEGTQVMVYTLPSALSNKLLSALLDDYSEFKQEQTVSYRSLIKEMGEVEPECVVFNWQCCSGYQCEHFNNEKEALFSIIGILIERGHMVMFSDFSLKALINDWSQEVLGKCPFVRIGTISNNVSLFFNPGQLKESPSAQLRLLGDLVESGECKINCASDTIQFSVDNDQIDTERYDLQILTITNSGGIIFTPYKHQIKDKEGLTGHVLLTYKSGGMLLASMSHWFELSRITPSEQKLFEVAERQYGATFATDMRNRFGSLPASERNDFLSSNAVNFVQSQAPCSNMNSRR